VNAHQRSQRNARRRRTLLRVFVWAILVVFVLTSVGVALINFTNQ
jgi:hypothetical protein